MRLKLSISAVRLNVLARPTSNKKMSKYLGLDRLGKLFQIVRQNGGLKNTYLKLYRNDDLKIGTLVGTDKYGNKYFENPYYFYGRNRWVEFADHVGMNYDGSQIPAEWFGWMHYKTDLPPIRDGNRPKYKWMADHSENHSGTQGNTLYSQRKSLHTVAYVDCFPTGFFHIEKDVIALLKAFTIKNVGRKSEFEKI